jgi:ADP-glucose pyrophosphorylase
MLRLKHLKRMRMTKNDVKLKENIKKFSDSLRYIANKIETEEERVKISNEILGIVQGIVLILIGNVFVNIIFLETFHVKNLNNLAAESAASKLRVESFVNEILKNDTNLFHYRFLTDIENIKSIRIYLENNVDCIDKQKQLKIAAKLREILNQAKIIQ